MTKIPCTDHLGNTFSSIKMMCTHWNISPDLYRYRMKKNWSLQQTLETPVQDNTCTDHLGNIFPNAKAMCDHYNITISTYERRMKTNWTLKQTLTKPKNTKRIEPKFYDHLGNKFHSIREMCKHWGINKETYQTRIKQGMSLEQALTVPLQKKPKLCTDHLGQTFKSISAMCKHYNINRKTYTDRLKHNWSQKAALTTPPTNQYQDHLGKKFHSIQEMCDYWKITTYAYTKRTQQNWSLEKTLTTNTDRKNQPKSCTDPYGNEFQSKSKLYQAYGLSWGRIHQRIKSQKSTIEILGIIPLLNQHIKNYTFNNHLTIKQPFNHTTDNRYTPKYFICIIDNHEVMMTYKAIIQYCKQHLPPEKNPIK